ncbi:MAG TPA: right-handed parallel beta-helix repeat-containing protein [Bacteroidales bacterium]|nr:right-handed parallel beta-helix repeat-containing protein [Bacteroidales bacterium]
MKTLKFASLVLLALAINCAVNAQINEIYVNPDLGKDQNPGSKEQPLKSLFEAAKRVNQANGTGAITIFLSEGIYGLDATVTFHPANWHFSKEQRLTIRAAVLPDDPEWNPGKMPVIVSTMPLNFKPNGRNDPLGGTSYGIQIETSHVTIQGLRVLGTPVHERPAEGLVRRNYPIVREGRDLDDLRITQCLFVGDIVAIPNHLAILASGQGVVVDHCVFYRCKDAIVFWFSEEPARNCEVHHNLFVGNYGANVWTWSAAEDLKFYNNVIGNTNVVWILNRDEKNSFTLSNSLIAGYKELVNKGGGPAGFGEKADPAKLKYGKDVVINKEGVLKIEEDPSKRNFLHLIPGTAGSDLGAGLFYK